MKLTKRRFRDKFNQIATFCIRKTQRPIMQNNNRGYITIFHDFEGAYALPSKADASYYGVTRLLDIEKNYNIKATYNVVGKLFLDWPEIIERIINEGHDLASHSYNHRVMTQLSTKQINADIQQSQDVFSKFGKEIQGFRSPQSRWNFTLMRSLLNKGLKWSAENDQSDYPYIIIKKREKKLIRLPIKMDDWDYIARDTSPEQMREKLEIEINTIKNKRCYGAIGFHPWVQGEVQERLSEYEKFISWLKLNIEIQTITFQGAYEKFENNGY